MLVALMSILLGRLPMIGGHVLPSIILAVCLHNPLCLVFLSRLFLPSLGLPPFYAVLDHQPQRGEEHDVRERDDGECPAGADARHERVDGGRGPGPDETSREIVRRRRGTGRAGVDVDDQRAHEVRERHEGEALYEKQDDERGQVCLVLHRPAKANQGRREQGEKRETDLEASLLDGEARHVLLALPVVGDAEFLAVPPVVPVRQRADEEDGHDRAGA